MSLTHFVYLSCFVHQNNSDPGFSQQVVIEETHDKGKGTKIEVKKMTDVTTGHRMLNIFYAIVASLFSGFLFVFCLQLLLFVVLDLSIESGATTSNPDLHIGNLLGVIFALIMFSHYFAEALVIAGQFISDSYSDHPLARTFILSGNKNGHLIIEWLFAACFLLIPIGVGIVSLLMARDDWWYITSLTWFSLVMVFFGMFCLNVVYYEVRNIPLLAK
jgi:lipase ATG15